MMKEKQPSASEVLQHPARIKLVIESGLLDPVFDEAFERLTQLSQKLTNAPIALLSVVDDKKQFFKSQQGLGEPWKSLRQTPLTHSFCQHVVVSGEPLKVEDARLSPLLKDNPAIQELAVVSYLGVPLTTKEGLTLGSFCVIDNKPRGWTQQDLSLLSDLADFVMSEIELRRELVSWKQGEHRRLSMALSERDVEEREAIGGFMKMVSHDLREPLNTVSSFAKLFQRRYEASVDEKGKEMLNFMTEACGRMSAMLRAISLFSQLDSNLLKKEPVEIRALCEEVCADLGFLLNRVNAEVSLPASMEICADPVLCRMLMANLISNAVKYRKPEKAPMIRLEVQEECGYWKLSCHDNGIGIAQRYHKEIFQLFRQLHPKGSCEGIGLGLALCRRVAELHGGDISVVSFPGEGSVFSCSFSREGCVV